MEKISSADVNAYMVKAAATLRGQAQQIVALKTKVASLERKEHAEKIASLAVERGALAVEEAQEYAENLATGAEDLKMVEDFVGRTSRSLSLGKTLEKTASAEGGGEPGQDVLTTFLLSSEYAE